MKYCYPLFTAALLIITVTVIAQSNFTYSPQYPEAGDEITFTYEPAGAIAQTKKPVEVVIYFYGTKDEFNDVQDADNIRLKRKGNRYTGKVKTDSSYNFLCLGFSAENKFDTNNGAGYYIILYEGGKVKKGAYHNLSSFWSYNEVGVERNAKREFDAVQQELNLYPDKQYQAILAYIYLAHQLKKEEAPTITLKLLEDILAEGLKSEQDYELLERIYDIASLPNHVTFISLLRKERFPSGRWQADAAVQKLVKETEPAIARALLEDVVRKSQTDSNWQHWNHKINILRSYVYNAYSKKQDWDGLKQYLLTIKDKPEIITFYQRTALSLQKSHSDLTYAEELSQLAVKYAKTELTHSTEKKPPFKTPKQWEQQRKLTYALCADTYARVLYALGKWKEALNYSQEAVRITNGENAEYNATYAELAEKTLPIKQYKKNLEDFVQRGKSTAEVIDILERIYVKANKSEEGFTDYLKALQKVHNQKVEAELRNRMKNELAPSFTLMDLEGNKVSLSDWKGNIVVLDFWATWCGPCIRSFPAFQKLINKYKDSSDIKFVFIDTREINENKKKTAADFLNKTHYNFYVLLDEESKVAEQYKVDGLPEKIIIDKKGIIRFRSEGYNGDDHKLIEELKAMIELSKRELNE